MHESTDDFTITVEYVRVVAEFLSRRDVDVDAWLRRSGLHAQPERQVTFPVFRRLVLAAMAMAREPALGLFVGERLVATSHGMVGFAAINSSTVRTALEIVARFSRLRTLLFGIWHEAAEHEARVCFSEVLPLGDIQRPLLEAVVLSIKNVFDAITVGACQVRYVAFPFDEPDYAPVAHDVFGCPVRYGCDWAGFAVAPSALELPIKLADPAAFQEARDLCQRELDRLAANETWSARVRRLLVERQHGFPSLNVTARMLHVTPRTLHRKLTAEGSSYRDQLESVRHMLALEHVKSGRFSMDEIAYRLGYTDLANFRRAFKRWEGQPPSAYRAAVKDDAPPEGR